MEQKKENIRKCTKALYIITKICFIAFCVAVAGLVLYATAFLAKCDAVLDVIKLKDSMGLNDIEDLYNYEQWVQSLFFIVKLAQVGIMAAILYNTCIAFKNISKDGIPFKMFVATRIRVIAILSLIYSLIPTMTFDTSKLSSDFSSGDMGFVVAIVFLGIAKIFEYGCILQQESDETL